MKEYFLNIKDLAPGDQSDLVINFNFDDLELKKITSSEDPYFEKTYALLWNEFGKKNELETKEVLTKRLSWKKYLHNGSYSFFYEILYLLEKKLNKIVAVRDHSVIVPLSNPNLDVILHLSHVWIDPSYRGKGLSAWLRAWPIQTVRTVLKDLDQKPGRSITLASEMEAQHFFYPERLYRLKSYEKAGFKLIDSKEFKYLQPDFRDPNVIDAFGGATPLPLKLVIRQVGRELENKIDPSQLKHIVDSLYAMYASFFRSQDMLRVYKNWNSQNLKNEVFLKSLIKPALLKTYYDPGFAAPLKNHIMPMHKFELVAKALEKYSWLTLESPEPVTEKDILRVHSQKYVEAIKTGQPKNLAESQKFPWSPELYSSVLKTSGGLLSAAQTALNEGFSAALVSGFHHAHQEQGEGFCTFNGLVVCLEALKHQGLIKTAAILDMDLHYGNGTALLLKDRPWIYALSFYGNDYWNNKAYRDVRVKQHPDGINHQSVALPSECQGEELQKLMTQNLPKLLEYFKTLGQKPDILLYQAGADPYYEDPYSPLKLDHQDLKKRDETVMQFVLKHQIPTAWVLAGGYTQDVSKVVQVHVNTFLAWREAIDQRTS